MATAVNYIDSLRVSGGPSRSGHSPLSFIQGAPNLFNEFHMGPRRARRVNLDRSPMVARHQTKVCGGVPVNVRFRLRGFYTQGESTVVLLRGLPRNKQRVFSALFYASNLELRRMNRENTTLRTYVSVGNLHRGARSTNGNFSDCGHLYGGHRAYDTSPLPSENQTGNPTGK